MLTGDNLPSYADLAAYLLYNAIGLSVTGSLGAKNSDGLFYSTPTHDYYLLYQPDINWLRSDESILDGERAKRIHGCGKKAVVFAAGKYMGQRFLTDMQITFCQIPYEMHRVV